MGDDGAEITLTDAHRHLLDPIAKDAPCGPDLAEADDDAFVDYYYAAEGRIPAQFFDPKTKKPFDKAKVKLAGETASILELLERSRDLRLLVLEARFHILAGKLAGFADCLSAIAALLDAHWADLHPQQGAAKDYNARKNIIEILADTKTVTLPLEFAGLFRDRRLGEITYRAYLISSGAKPAREDEKPVDHASLIAAIGSADNAPAVEAAFAEVQKAKNAISGIETTCGTASDYECCPDLGRLSEMVDGMEAMFLEHRADLVAGPADAEPQEQDPDADGTTPQADAPPAADISNSALAAQALAAIEGYYDTFEPSAPSRILVHQARFLIGKPISVVIDTLMPDVADRGKIGFGTEDGLEIRMQKMREISENLNTGEIDGETGQEFSVETREQATSLMGLVESYFAKAEPSSPIPILLFKARGYQNRDFASIVRDLFKIEVEK